MITYHYKCTNCSYEFEIRHSIKERKRKCPACKRHALEKVLYPCYGRVSRTANDMKTVGDLAKFNTDKLSQMEKQDRDHEYIESSRLAKTKLEKQSLEKPFYHKGYEPKDLNRRLNKATPKQRQKYIQDGDIPD